MEFKTISDQKRLVRSEHWAMARRILRERDKVHHAKWRVMMLAGPDPQEEIGTIRAALSKAHILAIDQVQENVEKAIAAGADDVACLDLQDWDIVEEAALAKIEEWKVYAAQISLLVSPRREKEMPPMRPTRLEFEMPF